MLRVPGIGAVSAYKIVNARKFCRPCFDDLKMRVTLKGLSIYYLQGKVYRVNNSENCAKCALLYGGESAKQLSVFDSDTALSVINGQL